METRSLYKGGERSALKGACCVRRGVHVASDRNVGGTVPTLQNNHLGKTEENEQGCLT